MRVSDNTKGFALAVVSSAFIGSSFILKKKGLKRAGKSGTRAGQMGNPRSLLPCVSDLSTDGLYILLTDAVFLCSVAVKDLISGA